MWLYQHHTLDELIDLDPSTLATRPVQDHEKPAHARVLEDLPVQGSYTVESGHRYYKFWTSDDTYVFAADDGFILPMCRQRPDGTTQMLVPGLHVRIDPVSREDVGYEPGLSTVRIEDGNGQLLYTTRYNATLYRRLHENDLTAAAIDQDLSDWDFFIALQRGLDVLNERAVTNARPLMVNDDQQADIDGELRSVDDLLMARTGEFCPRAGVWACIDDLNATATLAEGDSIPDNRGRDSNWVWSRPR